MQKKAKPVKNLKKIYVLGIALICSIVLLSVDECEDMHMAEQQYIREQAERDRAAREEKERIAQANADSQQGTKTTQSGTSTGTGGTTGSSTQGGGSTGANYVSSISGRNWKLVELRFTERTVVLNRNELSGDQADIFTLAIDNDRISGKGDPNRYFTSYQAGANNTLTIQPIANTMMAVVFTEPKRIKEPDYFQHLGSVKSWKVNQNRLELTTADADGKSLIMIFSN